MFARNIAHETECPYQVHVATDAKLCLSWSQDVTHVTFKRKRLLTINNEAGLEVTVDFSKLMANCQIKHAWARTIHTFQVSWRKRSFGLTVWGYRPSWRGRHRGRSGRLVPLHSLLGSRERWMLGTQPSFSFLFSLGSWPVEWMPPYLQWVFPHQWTPSRNSLLAVSRAVS